jgi:hypothetical protein
MNDRPDIHGERLTRADFERLPIERLAGITGLTPPPDGASADDVAAWREKAFRSYELDLENRAEWGTATQTTEPPEADGDA